MPIKKEPYEFNLTGGVRKVVVPEYYKDINTQLGITASPAASTSPRGKTVELYADGLLGKITISCKNGTKYRRTTVYCPTANLSSALASLEGKKFGTGLPGGQLDIINAYFPRKRRRSY